MKSPTVLPVSVDEALGRSEEVAALYARVFATDPWNEAMRCTRCGRSYGLDAPSACVDCSADLVEFYPLPETARQIRSYFSLNRARIAFALSDAGTPQSLSGFAWGWEESLPDLNDRKLSLPREDLDTLSEFFKEGKNDPVFYVSEFGVRADMRGLGTGKLLYQGLMRPDERTSVLMRTSRRSPAFTIATRDPVSPLRVVYDYRDSLSRVLLASSPSSDD